MNREYHHFDYSQPPETPDSDLVGEFENLKRRLPEKAVAPDPKSSRRLNYGAAFFAMALLNPEGLKSQVVNTADNLGPGNTSTTVSFSYLKDPKFFQKYSFLAQSLGINNRADLTAGIGITTIKTTEGEPAKTQVSVFGGGKINITQKDPFPKISLFSVLSSPLSHRTEGAMTLYSALIASKKLKAKGFEFTPYGGFTTLVPLGKSADKLFAPPTPQQSVATGVYKDLGKGVAIYGEYSFGVGENKGIMFTVGLDFPGQKLLKKPSPVKEKIRRTGIDNKH